MVPERTEVGRMPGDFSGHEYLFPWKNTCREKTGVMAIPLKLGLSASLAILTNRGSVRAFRGSISRDLLNR